MKISFAIPICNEVNEIKKLISFMVKNIDSEDEIIILYDEKNGDPKILDFLFQYNSLTNIKLLRGFEFKENFADWKNILNSHCLGDYIFQIDADEMISEYLVSNIKSIIDNNPEVDLFYLPRINTVNGITMEHINKWKWNLDREGKINFPDYQGRIHRSNLKWDGKVHEKIIGARYYSILPLEEEFCIQHHKTIERQEIQNTKYQSI